MQFERRTGSVRTLLKDVQVCAENHVPLSRMVNLTSRILQNHGVNTVLDVPWRQLRRAAATIMVLLDMTFLLEWAGEAPLLLSADCGEWVVHRSLLSGMLSFGTRSHPFCTRLIPATAKPSGVLTEFMKKDLERLQAYYDVLRMHVNDNLPDVSLKDALGPSFAIVG